MCIRFLLLTSLLIAGVIRVMQRADQRPDLSIAPSYLKRRDPVLKRIISHIGPCTLKPSRNHFITLAEAIVSQQLSTRAAATIYERLLKALRKRNPGPRDFLVARKTALLKAGLSRQKLGYLLDLSRRFEEKEISARKISALSDEEIIKTLTCIKGVGRWTAEMFLIFALNRPDVLPHDDLGLRKAMAQNYSLPSLPSGREMEEIAEPWRPYRSVGTWYMWMSFDNVPWIK